MPVRFCTLFVSLERQVSSRKIIHLPHPNTTKQTERYTRKVAIPFPRSRTPLASDRDIGGEKRGSRGIRA
ncbi:BZ3500_MvSof-1268-A1-R1_Chr3-1g06160 [Microbotryum saponariae]|uniref:BZ3500_MvSof-1268-A1-R1_Chr3-1g06160 protein n=1 Tax=Microbotryum saponariae TaxID=289078 RepID=A0A2X0NF40_9BASI|nr:BZ3500_MvSof-1268-A1-R1_Chr3-1g06160 [Microbotryum saponariae]SDA04026.1 BZ3501_MvSof-1269-A2-R1_Chr3-2g05845 [Microbotryum saponariae]